MSPMKRLGFLPSVIFATALCGQESGVQQKPPPPPPDARDQQQRELPPPPNMEGPPAPMQITLPAGTWITVHINQYLTSDRNQQGDAFTASLAKPLVANGFVAARRGQTIRGGAGARHQHG